MTFQSSAPFLLFLTACCHFVLRAQTPTDSTPTPVATPSSSALYAPPSSGDRWKQYFHETLGPGAFLRAGITAGIDQAKPGPPEWRGGAEGYAKRFGSRFGQFTISDTVKDGLSALLRQDTHYRTCECRGVFPRVGHALLEGVTARTPSGHRVVSIPSLIGPYSGALVSTEAWYPARYGPKDGLRLGSIAFGIQIGFGIVKEFVPATR